MWAVEFQKGRLQRWCWSSDRVEMKHISEQVVGKNFYLWTPESVFPLTKKKEERGVCADDNVDVR